jgi:hypothetical protein
LLAACNRPTPEKNYEETGRRVCMFYGGFDAVISWDYRASRLGATDSYTVRCKDGSRVSRNIWTDR